MANVSLVLDTIRNSSSGVYQERVPSAVQTNIQTVGNALLTWEAGQNEFLTNLINKIGLTIVNDKLAKNKLAVFKREKLEFGDTVEEIFIEIAKGTDFNPLRAETEVFKRVKPEVETLFHKINKEMMYKVTVQHNQLKRAFQSEGSFTRFVSAIVQSIYNGRVYDEYINMRELFRTAYKNGQAVTYDLGIAGVPSTQEEAKKFVKAVKSTSKAMSYMSDEFNFKKVHTFTEPSQQVLIIQKDVSIEVSTELLASAFNKGEFDYNTQVVEVDSFGEFTTGETPIIGALVDREWFMVLDVLDETGSIYNPEGLYWNHVLHDHDILSYSLFKNAVFFTGTAKA